MSSSEFEKRIEAASGEICEHLRSGRGYDAEKFAKLKESIRDCGKMTADSKLIPKSLALILVDAYSIIEIEGQSYKDGESNRILNEAVDVLEAIREALGGS